jgi:type I restriction enzyme S subunit
VTAAARLGDVAEVLKGQVPAKTVDHGDGPRIFGIAEISGHEPRALEPGTSLQHAVYLKAGDVVVALLGEHGLGATALIASRAEGTVLARECAGLRVTAPGLLPSWLYAWTKSGHFSEQIRTHASGGAMSRVSIQRLADFRLPLPPRPDQERLEAKIGQLDVALRSTTDLISNLNSLRDAEIDLAIAQAL